MQQPTQAELIARKLKERFCKNQNIPIRIFEEPFFQRKTVSHLKLASWKTIRPQSFLLQLWMQTNQLILTDQ